MLKLKLIFILMAGLIVSSSFVLLAQEEPKDQLYWIREEVVRVDMWQQY